MSYPPNIEVPNLNERGANGATSDTRLFVQLFVIDNLSTQDAIAGVGECPLSVVVYEDLNNPVGCGILLAHTDAAVLQVEGNKAIRGALAEDPSSYIRHDMCMIGRTYSIGYEADLQEVLQDRPVRNMTNKDWPWAVWYPLRRSGAFTQLSREEQMVILREHGTIGMGFGKGDLAHDIRLASHGLGGANGADNDFVVGLVSHSLDPISKLVEIMRPTQQTSKYLTHIGPFFVGKAVFQQKG